MKSLNRLKAHELVTLLRRGEISSGEIVRAVLNRIDEVEGTINAFITLSEEEALNSARRVDVQRARGEPLGPLAGIPVAIKDNICRKGMRTTAGSTMLSNFVPPYDAFVVRRLKEAGAVIIGATNLDEFAMGSSNENSAFGPVRNPHRLDRVSGGSSGGSAAAVAADETILALGSDTGGSVRQPASFCGVVGLRPTYGLISRYGLIAFASSLDQIGPLSKDVRDCALLLRSIAGHDRRDSTSINTEVPDYPKFIEGGVKGKAIGVARDSFAPGVDPEVKEAIGRSLQMAEQLGARVEEIALNHAEFAVATYYILAMAEASSNLARYDGVRYGCRIEREDLTEMYEQTRRQGFGQEVRRRIMLGTYALSSGYYQEYYLKAQKVRTLIRADFDEAFNAFDVILTPTAPTPAFQLGEMIGEPLAMYLSDVFTVSPSLAGLPAISIPGGRSSTGLPIGIQIVGRPLSEEMVLRVAYALEQAMAEENTGRRGDIRSS